jgi:signal peptidase II
MVVVWLAALVSVLILHHFGVWFQTHEALVGLGLAFGSAAGNLVDVLRARYVVDFIDLQWWPAFNLADVAIVAGLALALWPRG